MHFKGPPRSPVCQDRNSGAHGLGPKSEVTLSHAPGEQFCDDFVLFVNPALTPSLHYWGFIILLGGNNMEAKIHSGSAEEVAVFGAGVCRYLGI